MLADASFHLILQLMLVALASVAFLAAFVWAVPELRGAGDAAASTVRWPLVHAGIAVGVLLSLGLLLWRALGEQLPLYNYLDAFLILAVLLTGVLVYFRWTAYLRGLSLFLLPMIAGVLLLGGLLDTFNRGEFHDASVWTTIHVIAAILGSVCFAAGCVCGAVFLLVDRQLHKKGQDPSHRWIGLPPLASMERFMLRTIFLGFPLLTIAIVAGILPALRGPLAVHDMWSSPKFILGSVAWLVYALMLHVKWAPSFRGARAAWLSIIGFVLLMAVYFVGNVMPQGW